MRPGHLITQLLSSSVAHMRTGRSMAMQSIKTKLCFDTFLSEPASFSNMYRMSLEGPNKTGQHLLPKCISEAGLGAHDSVTSSPVVLPQNYCSEVLNTAYPGPYKVCRFGGALTQSPGP